MEKNDFTILNKSYSNDSILNSNSNSNSKHQNRPKIINHKSINNSCSSSSKKMGVKVQDLSLNDFKTINSNYNSISTANNSPKPDNTSLNNNINNTAISNKSKIKQPSFESSLILMHKFFKEQKIYSDPNDNYKRRTVVLLRSPTSKSSSTNKQNHSDSSLYKPNTSSGSSSNSNTNSNSTSNPNTSSTSNPSGEFGFNLQTYGLLNSTTKETEYICFVNNVQLKSPAKRAGLNNGDVLLAIDGLQIDQFKSFIDITRHVKGKNELRLVIMAENVCKKIQYQQRVEQIKKILTDKKIDLERLAIQEEAVFKRYGIEKINIPSPILDVRQRSFSSTPITNNNLMLSSSTSSNSAGSGSITNRPINLNNNSTFLSPAFSAMSGNVSESLLSSSNTSASVSNSSSFSSSVTNSSSLVKNSTPVFEKQTKLGSSNDLSLVKLLKPSQDLVSTANKPKSFAKKYLQQTSRLVRSASSTSMNLLSNFKINPTTISKEKENIEGVLSPVSGAVIQSNITQKPLSRSSFTRHSLSSNTDSLICAKVLIKDATTTCSSTDENFINSEISNRVVFNSNNNNNGEFLNGNFNKKKSLLNKLNNSAYNWSDSSFNRSLNLSNDESTNSQSNSPSMRKIDKGTIFNILTNKPKISNQSQKNYSVVQKRDQNNNEFVSIKSNFVSGMVEYEAVKAKQESSPNTVLNMNNSANDSVNLKNGNYAIARIKSNGGVCDLNFSAIGSCQDDDSDKNDTDSSLYLAPAIDYTNEDYVITRL